MRAKGQKCFRRKILFLLVSMATLVVMVTAVKEEVDKNEMGDFTQENTFENETGGNLTLEFDSGDLAFEREQTKHQLIIVGDGYSLYQFVECRGENIKSISALYCDSMEACEDNKSCLFDQSKCRFSWSVKNGRKCTRYETGQKSYRYGSSYYSDYDIDPSQSSCFRVQISAYSGHAGMVQCTSEEGEEILTTFDHFTINYSKGTLLSSITNVTSDMIKMKMFISSLAQNLNDNAILDHKNASVTLFVDEEVISLECEVPKLLFHKGALIIRVHRKDGSTLKLGPEMTSFGDSGEFLRAQLTDFRVAEDIVAFSCSAQRTNFSGQWLENWINVTVQDLPSELIVKSSECRNMTVDLTPGSKVNLHCELNGPSQQKLSLRNKMRKMQSNYFAWIEPKSNSIIEFVRFYHVAGEHLICQELDGFSDNSTWKVEHQKYYGDELRFHFIFNLAPSAPKIYRPAALNRNNSSSAVHLIYQEDHVVEQTLFCMFSGEPQPAIIWLKNGQELFTMKSMGFRWTQDHKLHLTPGNETLEHVKLALDSKVIQPSDFDLSESRNGKGQHVNFSCVASNKFGSDRLDFIITMPAEYTSHVNSSSSKTASTTTTTTNNFPVEHSPISTLSTTTTATENTKILTLATAPTLTSNSTEEKNLNSTPRSNSNSTESLERSDGVKVMDALAIVVLVLMVAFFLLVVFSAILRKRNALALARAQALAVARERILSFQNLVEIDRNESLRNDLVL